MNSKEREGMYVFHSLCTKGQFMLLLINYCIGKRCFPMSLIDPSCRTKGSSSVSCSLPFVNRGTVHYKCITKDKPSVSECVDELGVWTECQRNQACLGGKPTHKPEGNRLLCPVPRTANTLTPVSQGKRSP